MDLNWARTFFTVCVFISFMIVLIIVLNKRNRANYDDAAQSIVDDPDTPHENVQVNSDHESGVK